MIKVNTVTATKRTISIDMSALIFTLIADGDFETLKNIGFDSGSINNIKKLKIIDSDIVAEAIQKSLNIDIDITEFNKAIQSTKKLVKEIRFLHKFVRAGASFTMCRYFFSGHTNRNHTALRCKFGLNKYVKTNVNKINAKHVDEYFSNLQRNKEISAKAILDYAKKNNVCINYVWKELQIFINNDMQKSKSYKA